MKKIFFIFISLLYLSAYGADSGKLKIVQVITSKHIIIAEGKLSESIIPNQTFLVNLPGDQQCAVIFKGLQEQRYTFDTTVCEHEGLLKKNLEIEQTLVKLETLPRPEEKNTTTSSTAMTNAGLQELSFGASVHYSTADSVEFNDTIGNDVSFNGDSALGFGTRMTFLGSHTWGFIASLNYETNRQVDSISSSAGLLITYSQKPEFSVLYPEVLIAYKWEQFYIPFGFNYAIPFFKNDDEGAITGTVGAAFGLGYAINDNFSGEFLVRGLGFKFKNDFDDDLMGTGFLTGIALSGVCNF